MYPVSEDFPNIENDNELMVMSLEGPSKEIPVEFINNSFNR